MYLFYGTATFLDLDEILIADLRFESVFNFTI